MRADLLGPLRADLMDNCPKVTMCNFDPNRAQAIVNDQGVFPICDVSINENFYALEDWSETLGFLTIPPES